MTKLKFSILSLFAFLLTATIFIACSKENDEIPTSKDKVVNKFLKSHTFLRHKNDIESYGSISYKDIKSGIINFDKENISVIYIPVLKEGKVTGNVEVVDLKNTKFLPNKDTYALNYVNMENFNSKTLTGKVEMVDLNYDNFVHSKIVIENNLIKSWKSNGLSKELSSKYRKNRNPNKRNALSKSHLCDGDGNGDVTFSECYKCISDAIQANGFSTFICDFPVLGWLSCWGTKTAACIYISANN